MRKMAGLALMIGAALAAGCNSNNDSSAPEPGVKNVIFFLGDGMGLNTLTAARIYGVGEEGSLTIDTLPETAFIKTFSHDAQVTDSAPSMSAYMTGVKSNNGVISMDGDATQENYCSKSAGKPVTTLLELAKAAGRGTGVVTTTRVTHATPAAPMPTSATGIWKRTSPPSWYPAAPVTTAPSKRGWTWYSAAAAVSSCPRPTRASARMAATSSTR